MSCDAFNRAQVREALIHLVQHVIARYRAASQSAIAS